MMIRLPCSATVLVILQHCFFVYFKIHLLLFLTYHYCLLNYFWHQSCRKSLTSTDKVSNLSPTLGSDVRLRPGGSNEPLFDICCSPLADFHHYERLHQKMSHEVDNFCYILTFFNDQLQHIVI